MPPAPDPAPSDRRLLGARPADPLDELWMPPAEPGGLVGALFSFNKSAGLLLSRLLDGSPEGRASLAERALTDNPAWLASHLQHFSDLPQKQLSRIAAKLIAAGEASGLASALGHGALSLPREIGLQLAERGFAPEALASAERLGLGAASDLNELSLRCCKLGRTAAVEKLVYEGAALSKAVGVALAQREAGFVLTHSSSFGIEAGPDLSRVAELAIAQGETRSVAECIQAGKTFSADVIQALLERGSMRAAATVVRKLPSLKLKDPESCSAIALRLIERGFERAVLVAQSRGDIRLTVEVANKLLAKEKPVLDACVMSNLDLFFESRRSDANAAFKGALEGLLRTYGVGSVIESAGALSSPLWGSLEPDFKLRTFSAARSRLPAHARNLIDRLYWRFREAPDELGALKFVRGVERDLESLISGKRQDSALVKRPYYKMLMDLVFPDHSNGYTDFERNEANRDRSEHLERFKVRQCYPLCAYAHETLERKPKPASQMQHIQKLEQQLSRLAERYSPGVRRGPLAKALDDAKLADPSGKLGTEGRILSALMRGLAGELPIARVKDLLALYRLERDADPRRYFERRKGKTPFLHLRALEENLGKETSRTISGLVARALDSAPPAQIAEWYAAALASLRGSRKVEIANRADVAKLASGGRFLGKIEAALDAPDALSQRLVAVQAIAEAGKRDGDAKGVAHACLGVLRAGTPPEKQELALRRMVDNERRKIASYLDTVCEIKISPESIDLLSLDLSARGGGSAVAARVDKAALADFCELELEKLFARDLAALRSELSAYVPVRSKKLGAVDIEAVFTKNHTAAHAPQAGGVCTTGEADIWEMDAHFLMVLRDRSTKKCLGTVLCFEIEEHGRRLLSASFNPSSTYLKKVDQAAVFRALKGALIDFAVMNRFDALGVSTEEYIRTNRLGTAFEKEMLRQLNGKPVLALSNPLILSFERQYFQNDLQLLWARPGAF